jgi:hypothetical protein
LNLRYLSSINQPINQSINQSITGRDNIIVLTFTSQNLAASHSLTWSISHKTHDWGIFQVSRCIFCMIYFSKAPPEF